MKRNIYIVIFCISALFLCFGLISFIMSYIEQDHTPFLNQAVFITNTILIIVGAVTVSELMTQAINAVDDLRQIMSFRCKVSYVLLGLGVISGIIILCIADNARESLMSGFGRIVNGQYVLISKNIVRRTIEYSAYIKQQSLELRTYSGLWIVLSSIVVFYTGRYITVFKKHIEVTISEEGFTMVDLDNLTETSRHYEKVMYFIGSRAKRLARDKSN